jgi:hypothetical protein
MKYFSAEIFNKQQLPEKAKPVIRKNNIQSEDSIYFVEARKSSGNCVVILIYKS